MGILCRCCYNMLALLITSMHFYLTLYWLITAAHFGAVARLPIGSGGVITEGSIHWGGAPANSVFSRSPQTFTGQDGYRSAFWSPSMPSQPKVWSPSCSIGPRLPLSETLGHHRPLVSGNTTAILAVGPHYQPRVGATGTYL